MSEEIRCRRCGHVLTTADRRIEVAGAHEREVENPGGFVFAIACFDTAPGCVAAGEASDEATWFPGHTWQRAFCRGCTWHVGWLFRARTQVFIALDRARMAA